MAPRLAPAPDNAHPMPGADDFIDRSDALAVLAVIGDLSMGQPIDHSMRVAALSTALARHLGWNDAALAQVRQVALLRWSGCTANAPDVAATMRDDVNGRAAMLALQFDRIELLVPPQDIAARTTLSASIHCEVSGLVAVSLGLDGAVVAALGCVFEHWDGSGHPDGQQGDAIPASAMVVSMCSELEVLARTHGLEPALRLLRQRAGVVYPVPMVECAEAHAASWLAALDQGLGAGVVDGDSQPPRPVDMGLIGDVIDLKLPWLTGHSRAVVTLAEALAAALGVPPAQRATLRRAGWLHGLGRVAIPNAVWNRAGPLTTGEWERVRLAPYWTSRAARQVGRLAPSADVASHAFERVDGSGYFRGIGDTGLPIESRILAAAVAWVALSAARPWRAAWPADEALAALRDDGSGGRFDARVLSALQGCMGPAATPCDPQPHAQPQAQPEAQPQPAPLLTAREREVLQRIALGDSNKEAAKRLDISPSTVRTHLESVFRKLGCKTRAASTLRASMLGLLAQ